MADEVILDAIARLRVDDGNAVQEIASVVEAIKGELTNLANTRGINVGENLVQGIGPATTQIGELLFQIQKIIGLGPQFEQALSEGKFGKGAEQNMRALIQGTERLLELTRQVEAAQNQAAKGPVQGPVVAEREAAPRGANGRFISKADAERQAADAAETAARQAAAASPGPMITSAGVSASAGSFGRLDEQISEIERRIQAADPGDPDQYSRLNALQARFVAAEESFFDAQVAQNEMKEGADKKYAAAYAGLQNAGLNLLKELNALREQEVAAEAKAAARAVDASLAGYGAPAVFDERRTPRSPAQLDEAIRGTVPNPEALQVDRLQAAVAEATIAFKRATEALGKTDGTQEQVDRAEQSYISARKRLTGSTEALINAERKLTAAQEEQASQAATATSPRRAMLKMSSEEFLTARGVSGDESLRSQQLSLQLKEVEAQTAVIAGRAQENLTQTEMNKLLAEKTRLATRELGLQRQITEAKAREAREARGDGGFLGGVFGKNKDDEGYGQGTGFQAGITFKYFALYSAFSAGQRILEGLLETTRQYTVETNQLGIALRVNQDQAEATSASYGKIGAAFGVDQLKSTASAVKFIQSFRDSQGNPEAGAGEAGARVGSIVFALEPDDKAQTTIQALIGVAKSYELGASAAEDAYDKMLQVGKQYGYASVGEVAPGVAAVAEIGRQSGYDIPQLTALIASVMQSTGVGSDAAAGDVKRFLGSQNDPGMTRFFQNAGIDLSKPLYEKLKEYNDQTKGYSDEEKNTALLGLGAPRIAAAVAAALAGITQSEVAANKADDPNRLTAADQAQLALKTFSGQLTRFSAEVKNLFIDIAKSGVLDVLGAGVKGVETLIRAADLFVQLINILPGPVREVVGAFVALAAIARAQAFFRGSGAAGEASGLAARIGLSGTSVLASGGAAAAAGSAAAAGAGAAAPSVARGLAMAAGEVVPAATAATVATGGWVASLRAAAVGVKGLVAAMLPLATVIAGLMIVLDAKDSSDKQTQGATDITGGHQDLAKAVAAGDLKGAQAAIEKIKQARKETEEGSDSVGGKLIDIFSNADAARLELYKASDKDLQAKLAEMAAIEDARKKSDALIPVSEVFGKNFSLITNGVQNLKNKGSGYGTITSAIDDLVRQAPSSIRGAFVGPAEGQQGLPQAVALAMASLQRTQNPSDQRAGFQELHNVLANLRQVAAQGGDPNEIEGVRAQIETVDNAFAQTVVTQTQARVAILKRHYAGFEQDSQIKSTLTDAMNQVAQTGNVNALVQLMNLGDKAFLHTYLTGVNAEKNALVAQANALRAAAEAARDNAPVGDVGDVRGEQRYRQRQPNVAAANKSASDYEDTIAKTARDAAALADPTGEATTKPASGLEAARARYAAISGDSLSQSKAAIAAARANVKEIEATVGKNTAEWFDAMKTLNDALYTEAQGELSLANAKISSGAITGNPVSQAKAATAVAKAVLDEVTKTVGKNTVEYYAALKTYNDSLFSEADAELAVRVARIDGGAVSGSSRSSALTALASAQERFNAIAKEEGPHTAEYYSRLKALHDAQAGVADYNAAEAASHRASAVVPGAPLAQAVADIAEAQAALRRATDPKDYYDKLKALRETQYRLAQVEAEMASNATLLNIDITDPVARARAKVAADERKLRQDRTRGASRDVLLQDEVALRQDRSDAQGAAFSQVFSDQQTSYNLQKTSLTAYLSYLRSQHDYLSTVKNKTRQQVDELNQVDQALKSLTDSMQGQWNLGDIKVPTAYEMRRSMMGAGGGSTTTTYVNFYGSAEAEMKAALTSVLGQPVLQSAATAPPRV